MKRIGQWLISLVMLRNLNSLSDAEKSPSQGRGSNSTAGSALASGRPPLSFGLRLAILLGLIGAGAGIYFGVINKPEDKSRYISPVDSPSVTVRTRPQAQVVDSICVWQNDSQQYGLYLIYSDGSKVRNGFC
jgi:hypothetical protein